MLDASIVTRRDCEMLSSLISWSSMKVLIHFRDKTRWRWLVKLSLVSSPLKLRKTSYIFLAFRGGQEEEEAITAQWMRELIRWENLGCENNLMRLSLWRLYKDALLDSSLEPTGKFCNIVFYFKKIKNKFNQLNLTKRKHKQIFLWTFHAVSWQFFFPFGKVQME